MEQVEESAVLRSGKRHRRPFGEIGALSSAQSNTAFSLVFCRVGHQERDIGANLFSGFHRSQVVVRSLIGPSAPAVILPLIPESHVHGGIQIQRFRTILPAVKLEVKARPGDDASLRNRTDAETDRVRRIRGM